MSWSKVELSLVFHLICQVCVITSSRIINTIATSSQSRRHEYHTAGHQLERGDESGEDDDNGNDNDNEEKENLWKIIGITIGIVGLAIILVMIFVCIYFRKRGQSNGQKIWFWTRNSETKATGHGNGPPMTQPQPTIIVTPSFENGPMTQAPPPFNPHYEGKNVDDELPPPYDFSEISTHPFPQPELVRIDDTSRQRSVPTTEL